MDSQDTAKIVVLTSLRPLPAIMGSQDTAKVTALSFLSLPPEVRLQIYGHLLVHSSAIEPQYSSSIEPKLLRSRSRQALSHSRLHPTREFRPESAILRTCHQVYLEAMSVLYGENTFLYSGNVWIFDADQYSKVGFPDQNIQHIKHLELQVQPKFNAGVTVQYFVDRGCDLQTFKLSLKESDAYDRDSDDECAASEDSMAWSLAYSNELLTALVGLKVSKTLTISLSYSQKTTVDDKAEEKVSGLFRDHLIKSLASQKNFTVTEQKDLDAEFLGDEEVSEDGEDDGSEDSELFNEDDPNSNLTWYFFSWSLRPHHAKAQTDSASA